MEKKKEDLKTALKNASTQFRQAAAELENAKRNKSGIEVAQGAFDAASEKLDEARKADVISRNLGGKRLRRTTKRRSLRSVRRPSTRNRRRGL